MPRPEATPLRQPTEEYDRGEPEMAWAYLDPLLRLELRAILVHSRAEGNSLVPSTIDVTAKVE